MKALRIWPCALLAWSLASAVCAATPASARLEIHALLEIVGTSGCEFYRNGTWYDARRAQAHLQMKFEALAGGDQVASAEDFIARVATRSSFTGEPYQIRCPGDAAQPSALWLRDRLVRQRARGAPDKTPVTPLVDPPNQGRTINRPS
jgi:hypothetical protein